MISIFLIQCAAEHFGFYSIIFGASTPVLQVLAWIAAIYLAYRRFNE